MKFSIPERVCDSHVHVGTFPNLNVKFGLQDLKAVMAKYKVESAMVFSSIANPKKETKEIIKNMEDMNLYCLVRDNHEKYNTPTFLKSLEKLLRSHRIVGMKINPSLERYRVTDNCYAGCLEVLNENKAILLLHCGRWVEMSGWHYGLEVARKYPKLKVILAHMGGTHPDLAFPAIEACKDVPNVYMDTSQTRQIIVIKKGIEALGPLRILFGSDMPWGNYLQNLVGILELDLSEDVKDKILRGNFNTLVKGE